MISIFIKAILFSMLIKGVAACQSTSMSRLSKLWMPPSGPELLARAIDEGGEAYLKYAQQLSEASFDSSVKAQRERELVSLIYSNAVHWGSPQLMRATKLYSSGSREHSFLVFAALLKSPREEAPSLAWKTLLGMPEKSVDVPRARNFVDGILAEALKSGGIERHWVPEMAQIVKKWRVESVYSVVHMALLAKGDVEFVEAMIELRPRRSSSELMEYLALAPSDDLRQLALASIEVGSAEAILQHFKLYPPSLAHPQLGQLFAFGASRQRGLKEPALEVIDALTPQQPLLMAYALAKQPIWVQSAMISEAGRQSTPHREVLLRELAKITSDENISAEIALLEL